MSGDGIAGVERLDEGGVALGGVGMRGRGCFIEVGADHHQLHLVAAMDQDAVALLHRRGLRHKNLAGYAHRAASIGHALRMIAGRRRNNAPAALFLGNIRHTV